MFDSVYGSFLFECKLKSNFAPNAALSINYRYLYTIKIESCVKDKIKYKAANHKTARCAYTVKKTYRQ